MGLDLQIEDLQACHPSSIPRPDIRSSNPKRPAQAEMPFAMVDGVPVTELPRDLYIPPYALGGVSRGVRRSARPAAVPDPAAEPRHPPHSRSRRSRASTSSTSISCSDLQLELAGEYLVMAATLAEIKSRMLLPRPRTPRRTRTIRVPSSCDACRSTSATSRRRTDLDLAAAPRARRVCPRERRSDRSVPSWLRLPDITLKELLIAFKEVIDRVSDVRASPGGA